MLANDDCDGNVCQEEQLAQYRSAIIHFNTDEGRNLAAGILPRQGRINLSSLSKTQLEVKNHPEK